MAGGISQLVIGTDCDYNVNFYGGAVVTFSGQYLSANSFVIRPKDDLTASFEKVLNNNKQNCN